MADNLFGVGFNNTTGNVGNSLGNSIDLSNYLLGNDLGSRGGNAVNDIFNGSNNFSNQSQNNGFQLGTNFSNQNLGGVSNPFTSGGFNLNTPQGNNGLGIGQLEGLASNVENRIQPDFFSSANLFGTNKQTGLLPGIGGVVKDLGSLYLANKQIKQSDRQYADEKQIFNDKQDRLQEDSVRRATNALNASNFGKTMSQEDKDNWIQSRTVNSKRI